ncbi:ca2+-modulated nonselective cation channel polycystin protein [Neofusicoccum parvum]|uniref:Ca2+-modulated nonselective cation channel polycystin protein n=1 Tax=Neofusicoccum parvum TaxID=310453 RepID=A0ACB5SJ26_9PEZI|nr:ca2+-modulated nonselective cation channel polycystin protein [Neofusicoccum parvum]
MQTPYPTITQTGGAVAYTSTLYTDPAGALGPGTYVVVNVPAATPVTYPRYTQTSGLVAYTSTLFTDPPGALGAGTYVVVNVPAATPAVTYPRYTQTSGLVPYTTTVFTDPPGALGAGTYVVVNVPSPAYPTITVTGGAVPFTTTLYTDPLGALAPATYVVVHVPTPTYPTITVTGGAVAFTTTLYTDPPGALGPATYVVVNVPTPTYPTITVTGGAVAFTTTAATDPAGALPSGTYVIVNVPAPTYPTLTVTGGAVAFTTTAATDPAGALPSGTYVIVNVPAQSHPTITQTGGNVAYTSTLFTDPPGALGAGTYVVVNVPTPALTVTRTSGSQTFYATSVSTAANGGTSDVAVITVPTAAPFKIAVSDFSHNFYGYLDVLNTAFSGTAHSCSPVSDYTSASLFYIDPVSTRLVCASGAGTGSLLYSCQKRGQTDSPFLFDTLTASGNSNIDTTFWSDNTLHVTNPDTTQFLASLCNGNTLYLTGGVPTGCKQVVLSPVYSQINYLTTTITSGTGTAYTTTSAPAGNAVTQPGLVEVIVPSACGSPGIEYTNRPNPATVGSTTTDPYYQNFKPAVYNNPVSPYSTIRFSGVTDNIGIGISSPGVGQVYNSGNQAMAQSATIFRGYFYANVTGTWTFALRNPDDIGYAWIGPEAVSTWSNTNYKLVAGLNSPQASYQMTLAAGSLTPIRLIYADGIGSVSFTMRTIDPSGVIRDSTQGFFRQPECGPYPYTQWT